VISCGRLTAKKPPPDCPADSRAAPKLRLHRHNYLQVLVNISAIACGCARDAGHDTVAALTVPFARQRQGQRLPDPCLPGTKPGARR